MLSWAIHERFYHNRYYAAATIRREFHVRGFSFHVVRNLEGET